MKIEKNIPLPPKRKKYPFREMEIGDSILYDKPYTRYNMTVFSNAARNWAAKTKGFEHYKFSVRKVENNKIRLWRIK